MSTTFGQLGTGAIIPQSGFSPRQDPNGGWTASRDYAMSKDTFSLSTVGTFARGVSIISIDSTVESFWAFLKIESKQIIFEDGQTVVMRITFTGSANGQFNSDELSNEAQPQYSLVGSIAAVPLSEHPKFKALTDQERNTLGKLMSGQLERLYDQIEEVWAIYYPRTGEGSGNRIPTEEQVTSDDGLAFAQIIAEGETTYNRPTFTYTETTQGNQALTSAQLNKLGRIATPRGNPPEPNGARTWMLAGASQDQRGELYQTRLDWILSERGGHNAFLYDT